MTAPKVDYSDEWTDQDLEDLNRFCWERAAESLGETVDGNPFESEAAKRSDQEQ